MNPGEVENSTKPAAYDPEGRPLYYHPPADTPAPAQAEPAPQKVRSHITTRPDRIEGHNFNPQIRAQYANEPDMVHAHRPMEPEKRRFNAEIPRIKREIPIS